MSSVASYMHANTNHEPDPRFESVHSNNDQEFNDRDGIKKFRLRLSQRLHWTATLAFISYLILLISFASPYWLSSYKFTDSAFKRLGLWDVCFKDYRHPAYQYDTKFDGCHWIYSPVYTNIREWLQPPWFIFVQVVTTIALCASTLGLFAISVMFMHFLIQYQLIILCVTLICHILVTMLIGFALVVFYFKAFDRSWIMYPDFNHVDWAFFFALVSMGGNGFASYLYYLEIQVLKGQLLKMKRLVVSTSNGKSLTGGDLDSLDAVYATRSINSYNNHDNQGLRTPQGIKETIYPHFTQV